MCCKRARRRLPSPAWLPLAAALLMLACGRPVDRPLEGAAPRNEPSSLRPVDIPPTLAPPVFSPTTPPLPIVVVASPTPSPSVVLRNPILSGLLPAPDAAVPVGTVNIGARISGAVELAEILVMLDGAAIQPNITPQDPRTWIVAYASKLGVGTHEVRMNAKDTDGRAGGYRWQFEVKDKEQEKEPTRTPRPAPTRAPTKVPSRESDSNERRRS